MTNAVSQVTRAGSTNALSGKKEVSQKIAEGYRETLSSTYLSLTKIFSLKEGDPERVRLEGELDLPVLITTIEDSLGIHVADDSHSISSKPPLIMGLSGEYAKQWKLVINSLFTLSKLYELKFNLSENEYDKSKVGFNLEYARLMSFFYQGNSESRSSDVSDIKSRLIYFSRQQSIGRQKFIYDVTHGRNLLALSSWLAGEYCRNVHPIPSSQIEFAKQVAKPQDGSLETVLLKTSYRQRSFNF